MTGRRTCPVCEKAVGLADTPHSPFCSARCKNVDLNRWLSGGYVIAGNASGDESEGVDLDADSMADNEAVFSSPKSTTQH